jgi:hypothetical protein
MDNGLIFPYPWVRAHTESDLLTTQTVGDHALSGVWGPPAAWGPVR